MPDRSAAQEREALLVVEQLARRLVYGRRVFAHVVADHLRDALTRLDEVRRV